MTTQQTPPAPWDSAQPEWQQQMDPKAAAKAQKAYAKATRPWFKKKRFIVPIAVVVLFAIGGGMSGGDDAGSATPAAGSARADAESGNAVTETQPQSETQPETAVEEEATEPEAPGETVAQENARSKAEEYLSMSAFSRSGLIDQLKFEGFSKKDAIYGVDATGTNWMKQAAAKAEEYLDMSSFSKAGLIEQLEFEGFTPKQAAFGAAQSGL